MKQIFAVLFLIASIATGLLLCYGIGDLMAFMIQANAPMCFIAFINLLILMAVSYLATRIPDKFLKRKRN